MIRTVSRPLPFLALLLAAPAALADQPDTPGMPAEGVIDATYECESGQTIAARYDNTNPDAPTARLVARTPRLPRAGSSPHRPAEAGAGDVLGNVQKLHLRTQAAPCRRVCGCPAFPRA